MRRTRVDLADLLAVLPEQSRQPCRVALAVGVSVREVHRAGREGLSDERADRWAVRLRRVPEEIWPDYLDPLDERPAEKADRVFAELRTTRAGQEAAMGAETKIAWTDHTFNPWWGCQRVSPGCQHCYAESFAKRTGNDVWGKNSDRRRFGDKHWNEPVRWDGDAAKAGRPALTFCASMADVFEDRDDHLDDRGRLFVLIENTPHLIWQLLTKRPENVLSMVPPRWRFEQWPSNAWIGTTVEDQERADERIPELLAIPAPVRFLSCEPLLGPVDLERFRAGWCPNHDFGGGFCVDRYHPGVHHIDWIIIGGESGPGHRPLDLNHARHLRDQANAAGIPWFFKQVGGQFAHSGGDCLDGIRHKAFPPSAQRETVHQIADPWTVGRVAAGQGNPTPL